MRPDSEWKDAFPREGIYYETENGILYHGNCAETIKRFASDSVHALTYSPRINAGDSGFKRGCPTIGWSNGRVLLPLCRESMPRLYTFIIAQKELRGDKSPLNSFVALYPQN